MQRWLVLTSAEIDDGYKWYRLVPAMDVKQWLDEFPLTSVHHVCGTVYDVREDIFSVMVLKFS